MLWSLPPHGTPLLTCQHFPTIQCHSFQRLSIYVTYARNWLGRIKILIRWNNLADRWYRESVHPMEFVEEGDQGKGSKCPCLSIYLFAHIMCLHLRTIYIGNNSYKKWTGINFFAWLCPANPKCPLEDEVKPYCPECKHEKGHAFLLVSANIINSHKGIKGTRGDGIESRLLGTPWLSVNIYT